MNIDFLLPVIPGLQFTDVAVEGKILTLFLNTTHPSAHCPLCNSKTERIHSLYRRKIADLPWADKQLNFQLQVRRFFCDMEECRRKVFCERLHASIAAYARRTTRMESYLQTLGLHLGGEGAAVLARLLNISSISADTFLNLVRKMPQLSSPTPKILGIDEWAIRKGKSYATILVDLETRQVIDLLKDAKLETIQSWLSKHPGIEVISRDRDSTFAEGARKGAPQAVQVADRWHLLKNLGDAVKRMLEMNQGGASCYIQSTTGSINRRGFRSPF